MRIWFNSTNYIELFLFKQCLNFYYGDTQILSCNMYNIYLCGLTHLKFM